MWDLSDQYLQIRSAYLLLTNSFSGIFFTETLIGNIQGLLKVTSDNVRMVERQMIIDKGIVHLNKYLFSCHCVKACVTEK